MYRNWKRKTSVSAVLESSVIAYRSDFCLLYLFKIFSINDLWLTETCRICIRFRMSLWINWRCTITGRILLLQVRFFSYLFVLGCRLGWGRRLSRIITCWTGVAVVVAWISHQFSYIAILWWTRSKRFSAQEIAIRFVQLANESLSVSKLIGNCRGMTAYNDAWHIYWCWTISDRKLVGSHHMTCSLRQVTLSS